MKHGQNRLHKWKYLPAVALLLVTVLLWVGFHGKGQEKWENLQNSRLVFERELERMGADYGVMNSGPALTVTGGWYTVNYDVESDGENVLRITTTNGADLSPSTFVIPAGHTQGSVRFYSLDEIYNLQILVDYVSGSYIRVNRIDLIGNAYTDGLWTATFILLGISLLFALRACGWLDNRRMGELAVIAMAVLIASLPDMMDDLHLGHDSEFHIARLLNLVQGLRSGQLPVRVGAYMQNGYGTVTSVFYPELFMYIPAGMILLGGSITYSYHAFFIIMHMTAALTMRYAAEHLFSNRRAGTVSAILYVLSQYRLMNIYSRFAVGESLAMCFLPLFALGLYELILGDKCRWKLLALSATAICQSHMLTTVICGIIAVLAGALGCVKILKERRLWPIVKAAVGALLLNAFFLVPMLDFGQQHIQTEWMMRDLGEEALQPAQLLIEAVGMTVAAEPGFKRYALGIGTPLLIAVAAALFTALSRDKREERDWMTLLLCAAGGVCAVMSTSLFPWGMVSELSGGLAAYIQFPWRLLVPATLCFAFAGGYVVSRMPDNNCGAAEIAVLALCAVCMLPMLTEEVREKKVLKKGRMPEWDVRFADYSLPGTNLRLLDVQEPLADDDVTVTAYSKIGTEMEAYVSAPLGGSVVLPAYAFLGYEAEINGEPIEIGANENSHMRVTLDPGTEGTLRVTFVGKLLWRVCDAVSLAALLALVAGTVCGRRKGAKRA